MQVSLLAQAQSNVISPCHLSLYFLSSPSNFFFNIRLIHTLFYLAFHRSLGSFLNLSLPIQITQIRLPPNSNKSRKYTPILRIYERETESRHCRPELAGIDHRDWNGSFYPFPDFRQRIPGQKRLHAEEVGVEYRREAYLVDGHLRDEGEGL
jgi:hypothetical protein